MENVPASFDYGQEIAVHEVGEVAASILRNIEECFARFDAKMQSTREMVLSVSEKIANMQTLMHYHLGMTTEQKHQIAEIQKQVKDSQTRVASLEDSRT